MLAFKRFCPSLAVILFGLAVFGAKGQHIPLEGVVTVQNSKTNTGELEFVRNAQIKHPNAKPTTSNSKGQFRLMVSGVRANMQTAIDVVLTGEYENYMIVNESALKDITLGRKEPVHIYICDKAEYHNTLQRIYNINLENQNEVFQREIDRLNQKLSDATERLDYYELCEFEDRIVDSIRQVEHRKEEARKLLRRMAEDIARKNLDTESESTREIYRLLADGRTEQVISLLSGEYLSDMYEQGVQEKKSGENKIRESIDLTFLRAQAHAIDGNFDEAYKDYTFVAERDTADYDRIMEFSGFLHLYNQYNEARHYAEQALRLVTSLYSINPDLYAPDLADIHMLLGNIEETLNMPAEAERHLARSLELYRSLSVEDSDYNWAQANACTLIAVMAINQYDYNKAQVFAERALEILYGESGCTPSQIATLILIEADCLNKANRNNECMSKLSDGLEYFRGVEDKTVSDYNNMANFIAMQMFVHLSAYRYGEAERLSNELIGIAGLVEKDTGTDGLNALAQIYGMIYSYYEATEDYGNASVYMNLVIETNKKLMTVNPRLYELQYLKTISESRCYKYVDKEEYLSVWGYSNDRLEKLYEQYPEAYRASYAASLKMLGDFYYNEEDYEQYEKYSRQALSVIMASGDDNAMKNLRDAAYWYVDLGEYYLDVGRDLEIAEECFSRALECCEILIDYNRVAFLPFKADILLGICEYYDEQNMFSRSLDILDIVIDIFQELSGVNFRIYGPELASAHMMLGGIYQIMRLNDEALECFDRSVRIYQGLFEEDPKVWYRTYIPALFRMSNILLTSSRFEESGSHFDELFGIIGEFAYLDEEFADYMRAIIYITGSTDITKNITELHECITRGMEFIGMWPDINEYCNAAEYVNMLLGTARFYRLQTKDYDKSYEYASLAIGIASEYAEKNSRKFLPMKIDATQEMALLMLSKGDYDSAEIYFNQNINTNRLLYESEPEVFRRQLIYEYIITAECLVSNNRPDEARAYIEQGLALCDDPAASNSYDYFLEGSLLFYQGKIAMMKNESGKAFEFYDRAVEALAKKVESGDMYEWGTTSDILTEIAVAYAQNDILESAVKAQDVIIKFYEGLYALNEVKFAPLLAVALYGTGSLYLDFGQELGVEYMQRYCDIYVKYLDSTYYKERYIVALGRIGTYYLGEEQLEKARGFFQEACDQYEMLEDTGYKEHMKSLYSEALYQFGVTQLMLGDETGHAVLVKSLEHACTTVEQCDNPENRVNLYYRQAEIGNLYVYLGDEEKADEYYGKYKEITPYLTVVDDVQNSTVYLISQVYYNMGRYFLHSKSDLPSASGAFDQSLSVMGLIKDPTLLDLRNIQHRLLSLIEEFAQYNHTVPDWLIDYLCDTYPSFINESHTNPVIPLSIYFNTFDLCASYDIDLQNKKFNKHFYELYLEHKGELDTYVNIKFTYLQALCALCSDISEFEAVKKLQLEFLQELNSIPLESVGPMEIYAQAITSKNVAEIDIKAGDYDSAIEYLLNALGIIDEYVEDIMDFQDELVSVLGLIANTNIYAGNYDLAEAYSARLMSELEEIEVKTNHNLLSEASFYATKGLGYCNGQLFEEGIADIQKACEMFAVLAGSEPDNPVYCESLMELLDVKGEVYYTLGDYQASRSDFEEAASYRLSLINRGFPNNDLVSDYMKAVFRTALCREQSGDREAALELYRELEELYLNPPPAYRSYYLDHDQYLNALTRLQWACVEEKNHENALDYAEKKIVTIKAIEALLDPDEYRINISSLYCDASHYLIIMDQYEDAGKCVSESLEIYPGLLRAEIYLSIIKILEDEDREEEAAKLNDIFTAMTTEERDIFSNVVASLIDDMEGYAVNPERDLSGIRSLLEKNYSE